MGECMVCLDRAATLVALPCLHVTSCWPCQQLVDARTELPVCLCCRVPKVLDVFVKDMASVQAWMPTPFKELVRLACADVDDGGLAFAPKDAVVRVVEFLKFMHLKQLAGDLDGSRLSPPAKVDAVWHLALLRPALYAAHFSAPDGRVYDHVVPVERTGLQARRDRTWAMFAATFGLPRPDIEHRVWRELAPREARPMTNLRLVVAVTRKSVKVPDGLLSTQSSIQDLAEFFEATQGVPVTQLRFEYNDLDMAASGVLDTLCSYGIPQDGAEVYVHVTIRGC
jgi:hypothetical protein